MLLADVKPVGYHAWLDADTLVLFVLGSPPTLRLASVRTGKADPIVAAPDGSEDYAFTPDGRLLMAQGSWRAVADLEPHGLRRITRLAVSLAGDRLALVADPPAAR